MRVVKHSSFHSDLRILQRIKQSIQSGLHPEYSAIIKPLALKKVKVKQPEPESEPEPPKPASLLRPTSSLPEPRRPKRQKLQVDLDSSREGEDTVMLDYSSMYDDPPPLARSASTSVSVEETEVMVSAASSPVAAAVVVAQLEPEPTLVAPSSLSPADKDKAESFDDEAEIESFLLSPGFESDRIDLSKTLPSQPIHTAHSALTEEQEEEESEDERIQMSTFQPRKQALVSQPDSPPPTRDSSLVERARQEAEEWLVRERNKDLTKLELEEKAMAALRNERATHRESPLRDDREERREFRDQPGRDRSVESIKSGERDKDRHDAYYQASRSPTSSRPYPSRGSSPKADGRFPYRYGPAPPLTTLSSANAVPRLPDSHAYRKPPRDLGPTRSFSPPRPHPYPNNTTNGRQSPPSSSTGYRLRDRPHEGGWRHPHEPPSAPPQTLSTDALSNSNADLVKEMQALRQKLALLERQASVGGPDQSQPPRPEVGWDHPPSGLAEPKGVGRARYSRPAGGVGGQTGWAGKEEDESGWRAGRGRDWKR